MVFRLEVGNRFRGLWRTCGSQLGMSIVGEASHIYFTTFLRRCLSVWHQRALRTFWITSVGMPYKVRHAHEEVPSIPLCSFTPLLF